MQKSKLMQSGDTILRVLAEQGDKVLVINCTKQTMPVWMLASEIDNYSECCDEILQNVMGFSTIRAELLDIDQRKTMHHRYTMIAPVLSFLGDTKMRSRMIQSMAEEYGVSKQTIRSYLCQYLTYMDMTALAPKEKSVERSLTEDEKNMRWALNKFFYTQRKNSLKTAYTMMLKERYCSTTGELTE